jgi:hypothetical protein
MERRERLVRLAEPLACLVEVLQRARELKEIFLRYKMVTSFLFTLF